MGQGGTPNCRLHLHKCGEGMARRVVRRRLLTAFQLGGKVSLGALSALLHAPIIARHRVQRHREPGARIGAH